MIGGILVMKPAHWNLSLQTDGFIGVAGAVQVLPDRMPVIHTYAEFHSPKCWMFQDIGLPEWLLEYDSAPAAQMAETHFAIHDEYPGAIAKVKTMLAS